MAGCWHEREIKNGSDCFHQGREVLGPPLGVDLLRMIIVYSSGCFLDIFRKNYSEELFLGSTTDELTPLSEKGVKVLETGNVRL